MQGHPASASSVDPKRFADCYAHALGTIDSFNAVGDLDAIIARLRAAFSIFGIDHFIVAGLPNPHERFEKVVVLKHWSADWFDLYTKEQFVEDDPVVRRCRATTTPFEWEEASFDAEREPRAARLMNLAGDFGLVKGFSVPVHSLDGYEACFSVSGARPEFDDGARAALHLIALYAFERIRRLGSVEKPNPLTRREREVLTWAAVGKSHVDIAEIMAVTERTVTAHMVAATHKLDAANRTHAVVRAIQCKFIRI